MPCAGLGPRNTNIRGYILKSYKLFTRIRHKITTVAFGIQCKCKCFFFFLKKKYFVTFKGTCKQLTLKSKSMVVFYKRGL